MDIKKAAEQVKAIIALGKNYQDELNRELAKANIHVVYNHGSKSCLDYDNPENTGGVSDD